MTNGTTTSVVTEFLYWAVSALLALAGTLVTVLVRVHVKNDEDHRTEDRKEEEGYRARVDQYWREQQARLERSFQELDQKVHKYRNEINRIATRMRWADEDAQREAHEAREKKRRA